MGRPPSPKDQDPIQFLFIQFLFGFQLSLMWYWSPSNIFKDTSLKLRRDLGICHIVLVLLQSIDCSDSLTIKCGAPLGGLYQVIIFCKEGRPSWILLDTVSDF